MRERSQPQCEVADDEDDDEDVAAIEDQEEATAQLLARVDEFQPPHPTQIDAHSVTESEIAYMILQAWCYQATARLIIHQVGPYTSFRRRLRHAIASSILVKLETICHLDLCGSRSILFAYFVALTEMDADDPERTDQPVLERMVGYASGVAQASCYKMKNFLDFVWAVRDRDPGTSWLDLVASGPDFSVGL